MTESGTARPEGPATPPPASWRATALVFALSFAPRAGYNLFIHRPFDFLFSDMSTYAARGQALLDSPWTPNPADAFYPFGTHCLVAVGRLIGGPRPDVGVALLYAAMGATAATYYFLAARELFPDRRRLTAALGVFFALHPMWIGLGGFVLSETPFAACLAASTCHALRLARPAPQRPLASALGLGISLAIGLTVRPQILVSVPFLLLALLRRPRPRAPSARGWALLIAPSLLALAFSAARMQFHTGQLGLVSKNGAFNFAFGRCHAREIVASNPRESYQPPSFRALAFYEDKHGVKPFPELDPALGEVVTLPGPVYDDAAARALAKRCMAKTGPLRQVKYALTHLVLLFAYTMAFPLKGMFFVVVSIISTVLVLPTYLLAIGRAIRRRDHAERVLSSHVLGLTVTAMLFFGEIRLRVPYDGILLLLTALYATRALAWWRERRLRASAG